MFQMHQGLASASLIGSISYPNLFHSMVDDYSVFSGESVYKAVPSKYGSEYTNPPSSCSVDELFAERGRPSYYSKDLQEFQRKRASFTNPEERDNFVKERQELVFEMETVRPLPVVTHHDHR